MSIEREQNGGLNPEEIKKLQQIKTEKSETVTPRDLFKKLAIRVREVGLDICNEFKISDGEVIGVLKEVQDPESNLAKTIATGITSQELDSQFARDMLGECPIQSLDPYANFNADELKVISWLLLQTWTGKTDSEWITAYNMAVRFAQGLGFLKENETISRENDRITFLKGLGHSMSPNYPLHFNKQIYGREEDSSLNEPGILHFGPYQGLIKITHPQDPLTLTFRLTNEAIRSGYWGIPQYPGKGIGMDLMYITYTPEN